MKKTLNAFVAALSLSLIAASCGQSQAASAIGTYDLDKQAFEKVMKEQMPAPEAANEEATKMMEKMMAQMMEKMTGTLELKAEDKFSLKLDMPPIMSDEIQGTWKLDGQKLSITGKGKDGKEQTKDGSFDGKSIVLTDEKDGKKVEMRFVKSAK